MFPSNKSRIGPYEVWEIEYGWRDHERNFEDYVKKVFINSGYIIVPLPGHGVNPGVPDFGARKESLRQVEVKSKEDKISPIQLAYAQTTVDSGYEPVILATTPFIKPHIINPSQIEEPKILPNEKGILELRQTYPYETYRYKPPSNKPNKPRHVSLEALGLLAQASNLLDS